MRELLKSKYYKVRLNRKDKIYTITNNVFNTKTQGLATIKNNQYEIVNVKNLSKMELNGWVDKDFIITEVKTEQPIKSTVIVDLTGDSRVEADILAYERKMALKQRINGFIDSANGINMSDNNNDIMCQPFSYDKQWSRYYKKEEKLRKYAMDHLND